LLSCNDAAIQSFHVRERKDPRRVGQASEGRPAWCYFNNDIHGHAIEDARALKAAIAAIGCSP